MKKYALSAILAVVMIFFMSVPASAATQAEPSEPVCAVLDDSGIELYAASKPDYYEFVNLAAGSYDASLLNLAAARGSYTAKCFVTSTGKISLQCSFRHSGDSENLNRSMTISLYKYNVYNVDGSTIITSSLVESKDVSYSTTTASRTVSFTGLDSTTHYYILFKNTSSTSTSSGLDISGSIKISQ